ncbi:MAG TPA: YdiU family protein [Polyangiaceae bacterium]|nr:YdiU family protein [Polyangiaceae bacterium]
MTAFDDRFVRELPSDRDTSNVPRAVFGAAYTSTRPTPVRAPKLIAYSREVAAMLGLTPDELQGPEWVAALAGNRTLAGMKPFAACYGGHQFGNWAGQLGDGRAITLGEVIAPTGQHLELQLKGAGRTPYSRTADGRAVLRSSLREFLCSEAMHHLGIPTTRALSLVVTGEQVVRDVLYDGHPAPEPGAIVARVAPSFLRFGNFELPAKRGDLPLLRSLAEHTLRHHFAELVPQSGAIGAPEYQQWLSEIARRTGHMLAGWMRVGFVHGVMNTDNMSILGLTIDYGPYGWLEDYDPTWTPNTTDAEGRRYRFGNQPRIAAWNLLQLAQSIEPLAPGSGERTLEAYASSFQSAYRAALAAKLGLEHLDPDEGSLDDRLLDGLFEMLHDAHLDMTLFFRQLADLPTDEQSLSEASELSVFAWFGDALYDTERLTPGSLRRVYDWVLRWAARTRQQSLGEAERRALMNAHNPQYVLRNWMAQQAIDAATRGDYSEIEGLLELLRRPYELQAGAERYAQRRPEWARHRVGCSMLSCSS